MQPQLQVDELPHSGNQPFKALAEIFYSPSDAYVSLKSKRPWVVPMLASIVMAILMNFMMITVMGIGTITRNRLESSPSLAERLGPAGINEAVRQAETSTVQKSMGYVGAMVAVPVMLCITAGLLLGVLMIMGTNTNFNMVLGASALSTFAVLVAMTLCTAVALAARSGNYEGLNPEQMVMLNVGAFLPDTVPKFLRGLASGIDLIGFWGVYMQSVGVSILSERVTLKQAFVASAVLYVLWTLVRAGFGMLF
jgi:hypothetical protein